MQLFLSLNVSDLSFEDIRFSKLIQNLEKGKIEYYAVPVNHLNIPLIQIPDVAKYSYIGLKESLKKNLPHHKPFTLKLSGLQSYPSQEKAEMLWIGVQNSRELRHLQEDLAATLNIKSATLLHPHIPFIHLKKVTNVSTFISPFKNFNFGHKKVKEIKLLEKLPNLFFMRYLGSLKLEFDSYSNDNFFNSPI